MKARLFRTCSWILVLVLLINMIPAQVFATESEALNTEIVAPEQSAESISSQEEIAGSSIITEIEESRTEFSKEYKLSNGLNMVVVYSEAVHYEEDGEWKDIDNTLQTEGAGDSGVYKTTAGAWHAEFPQHLDDRAQVTISKDGYSVSFGMAGELRSDGGSEDDVSTYGLRDDNGERGELSVSAAKRSRGQVEEFDYSEQKEQAKHPEIIPDKLRSRLEYPDVYDNTDIIYDLDSYQVKESVVINQYDASLRGYQYTLDVGSLVPVLNDDGSIDLFAPDGKEAVMTMPAPYMVDDAGAVSMDVTVMLVQDGGTYILAYELPQAWLASEERAWPVVLDPVVIAKSITSNIQDRTVVSEGSTTYIDGSVMCGYTTYASWGKMRTYIQFEELPTLTSADVIVNAALSLYACGGVSATTTTIEAHQVTETWTSQGISWADQPSFDSLIEDYCQVDALSGRFYWDITDAAKSWYTDGNYGVVLKVSDTDESSGTADWKQFYSIDCDSTPGAAGILPYLTIEYRNANGLESYWDYTSSSAGRAGTGYVNNYTGNLTWVHNDIGFDGNRMPVSISHVYNANDINANGNNVNTYGLGYGWQTNYNQTISAVTDTNNSASYVWEDGDGTKHYFKNSENGSYEDEDGLELTLAVSSYGAFTITDKYGNKSSFDTIGRLVSITKKQATTSSISITYANSGTKQISTIKDGAGRTYKFTYTNSLLTRISYVGTGTTEIAYIAFGYTNNKLTSITNQDGKIVRYTYDSNGFLTAVTDVDGYKLQYSYSSSTPKRVTSIKEYDGSTLGGSLSIEYAHNQTTLTDHNGNIQITQFNDWGNPVSVQDGQGRAAFAQYALNDLDDTEGKGNQLRLSSKMQNTVGNRVRDGSFEVSDYWPVLSSAITTSRSTDTAYMGDYSLKMVRATAGEESGIHCANIKLAAGLTYTLSGYVKTGSGSAYLGINDGSTTVVSEPLAANSDWTRLEVSYTNTSESEKTISIQLLTTEAGTTYLDCVQLELAATPSRYSLITHNDFRSGGSPAFGWTGTGLTSNDKLATSPSAAAPELEKIAFRIIGSPTTAKTLSQVVKVEGSADDAFVLAGWALADSAPLTDEERTFALKAVFNYTDGTKSDAFVISFNPDMDSSHWQYAAGAIVAKKAYSSITVTIDYSYNVNTAYFDGIQLYKEEFGTSYTYDDDGNVTSVEDLQDQITTYEYDTNGNLSKILQNNKAKMTYTYDDHHNVKTATTATGVVYEFTYDAWGNNTSVSIVSGDTKITSTATYSSDGNRLVSTTDALGNTTEYSYNANTNVLEWVQYPEDTEATRTEYSYDSMYRLASAAADVDSGYTLSASYTYTDDLLTKIQTNSTTYSFTYGDFAQVSEIGIGDWTLATYSYTDDQNRYLESLDYGNGDSVNYTYDEYGRVTKETFEDGDTVTYQYDNSGALAIVTDSATGIETTYYYDLTDRLMKYVESGNNYNHSVGYEYDTLNNLTELVETINGVEYTTSYTYDDDNRISSVSTDNLIRSYSYDTFGRISQYETARNGNTILKETITYNGNQVETYVFAFLDRVLDYTYAYDDNGNIIAIYEALDASRDPEDFCIAAYTYDSANQLVREDNQASGWTYVWTYDDAGNILSRTEYAYTTGELGEVLDTFTYTYGDSDWGDLLTSYDGNTITYDGIGNPLSDGTWTYTWEHGRELASMTDGSTTWTYTYDANGMRTKRGSGSTTYTYVYNGGQLAQMTVGDSMLYFTYDAAGRPMSVTYGGSTYYYAVNLQGDVTAILNISGIPVVAYMYDAWGNILSITGSAADTLGILNPLRYRGYVYDQDTGLYYLQSRYYNPKVGRFLNADGFISTGQGFIGNNMFAFCGNDPVNRYDISGSSWLSVWNRLKSVIKVVLHGSNTVLVSVGFDTAAVGAKVLSMKKDGSGIYHATFDCWQQYFGYNDMYDFMFDVGTSMKSAKFKFSYNNQKYIFWAWKGNYINLGAGAELGIYYGGGPHWLVDKNLAMKMSLTLKYNGKTIISYTSTTWWITGFNPQYLNVKASELTVTYMIWFNSKDMFNAFRNTNPKGWSFNSSALTATYTY